MAMALALRQSTARYTLFLLLRETQYLDEEVTNVGTIFLADLRRADMPQRWFRRGKDHDTAADEKSDEGAHDTEHRVIILPGGGDTFDSEMSDADKSDQKEKVSLREDGKADSEEKIGTDVNTSREGTQQEPLHATAGASFHSSQGNESSNDGHAASHTEPSPSAQT